MMQLAYNKTSFITLLSQEHLNYQCSTAIVLVAHKEADDMQEYICSHMVLSLTLLLRVIIKEAHSVMIRSACSMVEQAVRYLTTSKE